jgi:hypothetical protein
MWHPIHPVPSTIHRAEGAAVDPDPVGRLLLGEVGAVPLGAGRAGDDEGQGVLFCRLNVDAARLARRGDDDGARRAALRAG